MSDAHERLTEEYERLIVEIDQYKGRDHGPALETLAHILRRLGPPGLTEASEIERREAIAADAARE